MVRLGDLACLVLVFLLRYKQGYFPRVLSLLYRYILHDGLLDG